MEDKNILFGSIILFIVILLIFSNIEEDDKIIGDAVQYSNNCRGR